MGFMSGVVYQESCVLPIEGFVFVAKNCISPSTGVVKNQNSIVFNSKYKLNKNKIKYVMSMKI
jgi:hypothetical protein